MSSNTVSKFSDQSTCLVELKLTQGAINNSGDELWSVAFSKVGCKYGKPIDDKEMAKAIQAIIPSRKCISQGQMISNHVEYFTWFDTIIEMRVSFYKNQII